MPIDGFQHTPHFIIAEISLLFNDMWMVSMECLQLNCCVLLARLVYASFQLLKLVYAVFTQIQMATV